MIRNIKHFLRLTFLYATTRILYIFNRPPKVIDSINSLKKLNNEELSWYFKELMKGNFTGYFSDFINYKLDIYA